MKAIQRIEWARFLWVVPLGLALVLFPIKGVNTSPDAAWYIAEALNIYNGIGDVDAEWNMVTARGLVFPSLIAVYFHLFGVSVRSALWVVRTFFVLNVLLAYIMGTRFFSRGAGLAASFLVLSSFVIHQWSSFVLLDVIWPFFILLTQLLLFLAFERERIREFVLAGVTLGTALFVKESAILFVPFPILIWLLVPQYRVKRHWKGLSGFLGIVGSFGLLWLVRVCGRYPSVAEALYQAAPGVMEMGLSATGTTGPGIIGNLWSWLVSYYENFIVANFTLAPLLLVAWAYTFYRAIVKACRPCTVMISGLLLFSPIILLQGKIGMRSGQSVYLFLLSYLALARLLCAVETDLPDKITRKTKGAVGAIVVSLAIAVQVWVGEASTVHFLSRKDDLVPEAGVYTVSFFDDDWHVGGWHNDTVSRAAQWLHDNAPADANVMVNWEWSTPLYFYLGGQQPLRDIPYVDSYGDYELTQPPHVLFLWPLMGRTQPGTRLDAMLEERFLNAVQEQMIDYVVVTRRTNFLALYLCANPGFEQVASFDRGAVKIFKVIDVTPLPEFPTHIEPRTITLLEQTRQTDLSGYTALVQDFFVQALGWTEAQVDALLRGELSFATVESNRIYCCYDVMEYVDLAQMYLERGKTQEAIEQYEEAIRLDPCCLAPHEGLGDTYLMQGRVDEAVGEYEKAIDFAPGTADYHSELGFLLYSRGLNEKAIEEYLKAIDLDSYSWLVYLRLGVAYRAEGRLEGALEAYERAIKLKPDYITAHVGIGQVYEAQEEWEQAIAVYTKAIHLGPDSIEGYRARAWVYYKQGDYERSLNDWDKVIELRPDYVTAHVGIGRVYEAQEEWEKAIAAYTKAIHLGPDSIEGYQARARVYYKQGDYERSLSDWDKVIELKPDYITAHVGIGQVYEAQEEREKAIAAYQRAIEIDPKLLLPYVSLGNLYRDLGEVEAAIDAYERAVALRPDSVYTYIALGKLYEEQGRVEEAVAIYKKATNVQPDRYDPHVLLGKLYETQGNMKAAIEEYGIALELNPDNQGVRKRLEALQDMSK